MSDYQQITALIHDYFDGLHYADIDKLDNIFDDNACLQAPDIRRTKQQWLELVATRQVPAKLNHSYQYQILNIEIIGQQAMVKVDCPLLGNHYIDFLSLLKENNQWRIVNKLYADLPEKKEVNNALR
ncbi:hypothetical protein tinsulaeT_28490 [Thalassotalea insulae]|uniref:Nuclear transport factor 2 family protein n=1 Tax=Thalassotalea insulae TaxID=2056778 RepID=A0ABQ6GWC9_9GAMM|nr:nuclear transport factor 2 family protein [Thalassotalea insulae]GLX79509.1 hypothetical protein tinsulaeT_28490 [Thalassotalea insulae]